MSSTISSREPSDEEDEGDEGDEGDAPEDEGDAPEDEGDAPEECCGVCLGGESLENDIIVFCDGPCLQAFHQHCLEPPLTNIPDGEWLPFLCKHVRLAFTLGCRFCSKKCATRRRQRKQTKGLDSVVAPLYRH
jgi:hypothetical protein